jgi:hypothetical protein
LNLYPSVADVEARHCRALLVNIQGNPVITPV